MPFHQGFHSLALAAVLAALFRPASSLLRGSSNTAVMELDDKNFGAYMLRNEKVLVDFYNEDEQQAELSEALVSVREYGSQVPFAKVNGSKHAEFAKRFVPNGRFPQLVWFRHGEPTTYHRRLRQAQHIASFAIALDRDPMMTVTTDADVPFNPAVFAQLPKKSPMYKVLEVVSTKHMDTVAFAHKEMRGQNVSWIVSDRAVDTYTGGASVEEFEHWVNTRLTISEDLPDDAFAVDSNDVQMVVGSTFEDLVLKNDKDVFLMVYAPWVGYSLKLFPVWNAFAREVADVEHLMVAKMDGDRNRSPLLTVDAFPSLMYFKAGNSTPNVFRGNRTVDELIDFANEHGSFPITPASMSLIQKDVQLQKARALDGSAFDL